MLTVMNRIGSLLLGYIAVLLFFALLAEPVLFIFRLWEMLLTKINRMLGNKQ